MCLFAYFKKKGFCGREDIFLSSPIICEKKTVSCGREDPALCAVRPPVNITFLEKAQCVEKVAQSYINPTLQS